MKLTLTQFVSLDGVSQGPGSPDEDTSGGFAGGGWFVPHMDQDFIQHASEWLSHADGLLFGRRTYDAFARDWPEIIDPNDPFTARMNSLPKYVVTKRPTDAAWNPTTVISGNVVEQLRDLKSRPGGELQIHGSSVLAQSLFAAGLIDEMRLVTAPVVVGHGRRLFPDGGTPTGLVLLASETSPGGLTLSKFAVTGSPGHATYTGVGDVPSR